MWSKRAIFASILALQATVLQISLASIHDCWDPAKLTRMKFPTSHQEANDPSLGKFSKLLKCMMREQSKEPGGLSNMDWGQWQAAGGNGVQFPPNWNQGTRNQQPPGWIRPGSSPGNQNLPNNRQPPQQPGWPPGGQPQPGMGGGPGQGPSQPRPGVHPDDWNNNNRNAVPPPPNGPPQTNPGWPPQQPPPPPPNGPPPGWETGNPNRNNDRNRKKNRRKNQQNQQDFNVDNVMIPSPGPSMEPGLMNPAPTGTGWGTMGGNVGAMNDEESQTMTKNRQFGYAIMACAVVALAVLMVSAIFCCNSSNSTMSQPATQVSVQPPDTFSIYSYSKQPVTDTLRSGPLGDTLRNETLRSTASPQYRVSDIDPDFARRFREEHY